MRKLGLWLVLEWGPFQMQWLLDYKKWNHLKGYWSSFWNYLFIAEVSLRTHPKNKKKLQSFVIFSFFFVKNSIKRCDMHLSLLMLQKPETAVKGEKNSSRKKDWGKRPSQLRQSFFWIPFFRQIIFFLDTVFFLIVFLRKFFPLPQSPVFATWSPTSSPAHSPSSAPFHRERGKSRS